MYAVSDESRTFLMRLSVMIVCGGTAILPFTVPPTSATARAQSANHTSPISVPDLPGKLEFPAISVERDPFVSDAPPASAQARLPFSADNSPTMDDIGIVLPPNDGARSATPVMSAPGIPVVRGVVLGDVPEALVDFGSGVKVVSVGDSIGNDNVRTIDAGGVTLSSGLRLRIAGTPR